MAEGFEIDTSSVTGVDRGGYLRRLNKADKCIEIVLPGPRDHEQARLAPDGPAHQLLGASY